MKILHTADWHIGNFPGPEINGENERFLDISSCLHQLATDAERENPDVIIIAGDLFHQAKVWADRGLKENGLIVRYLRRLVQIAPVVVVRGTPNHDSERQYDLLQINLIKNENFYIYTMPGVHTIETYSGELLQIAALPGFDRGYFRAQHPGLSKEEENEVFTSELENIILGMKAQCDPAFPSVLVAHYTVIGSNMESGQTQFFSQFEPVIYPSTLEAADFTLTCLGHIHRPQKIDCNPPAYYSGAITGLNFNDEGQERGYYIHELIGGEVVSHFNKLTTRQFETIRLNDADIAAIVSGSLDDVAEAWRTYERVKAAIVRVLYECTDEHNKAFNKALLEKALYDDGAFWVQEISPAKISITVNRNEHSEDDTPEEQITRYFEEKEYAPERIAEIIDVARPIIAEASEKVKGNGKTGIFTPVRIEVKNYRNYREESFDYDGIRFCTINGENGAGKSSLFMDAMLDALYEEPREGDLTGWICNDPEVRSGSIQFTFMIGDSKYRVTRTRLKSGKPTLNISEEIDGEWQDRSAEKIHDTQEIIENIVGMDSLTFKACALIMQDQYGLFLQADKESRMTILGSILGLGIYDRMEDMTQDRLTDINREIRNLKDKVCDIEAGLPDISELTASIQSTKELLDGLKAVVEKEVAELDVSKATLSTKKDAYSRVIRIIGKRSALVQKRDIAETNKATQANIIYYANVALSEEEAIKAGVAEYNALLEKEKTLISARDRRDDLTRRRSKLTSDVVDLSDQMKKAEEDRAVVTGRIEMIDEFLDEVPELTTKHEEYLKVLKDIDDLQAEANMSAGLQSTLMHAERRLAEIKNEASTEISRMNEEISGLKRRVALLGESGCPMAENASCRFLADAIEARDLLPEKEASLKEYEESSKLLIEEAQEAVDSARSQLEMNKYSPSEMMSLKARLTALQTYENRYGQIERTRSEKTYLETRVAELDQTIASISDRIKAAEKERDEISDLLVEATKAAEGYDELSARIRTASVWVEKEKNLPVARERFAAATARTAEIEAEIEQINAEIKELEAEREAEEKASEGAAELERFVMSAEREISEKRETINATSMKLGALQKQATDAEAGLEKIKDLNVQISERGKLSAILADLKSAFSQDGIPHNVIRSIIPIFEATATGILGQMSGGKMSVEFITEKVLKSNNKKEVTTLDIVINDAVTGRLPYMSRSGGERVKAALSVILALSEIKSNRAGVQLGFLFIDEPPFLDSQGVQAYCDALEAIQSRYADLKIMAITHDPSMKSRFPQSVDVVKTAEGSKVIYQ